MVFHDVTWIFMLYFFCESFAEYVVSKGLEQVSTRSPEAYDALYITW